MLSQNPAPPREHVDQGLEFRGWSLEPGWVPHVCPPLADVGFAHRAPHFLCSVLRALVVCTQLPAPRSRLRATPGTPCLPAQAETKSPETAHPPSTRSSPGAAPPEQSPAPAVHPAHDTAPRPPSSAHPPAHKKTAAPSYENAAAPAPPPASAPRSRSALRCAPDATRRTPLPTDNVPPSPRSPASRINRLPPTTPGSPFSRLPLAAHSPFYSLFARCFLAFR